ncbi:MAG TPA: 6-phosphogluconolactonase [Candidatus Kryptonia bacterium]|nr:6-phosphogluconolactonase [Candidatus Kryptonia bacterium]
MAVEIAVLPTSDALMRAAAEHFVSAAARALDNVGRFTVALAGGSTPKSLYALLATGAYAARVDWSRVQVFWGDERCVAPADPTSNFRMTDDALLAHVSVPPTNIHRIHGEDDPHAAAAAYEREMRAVFATPEGPPRTVPGARFDLVLLGMGDNGHTASLFPRLSAVREQQRWATAAYVEEVSMWRVTLTPVVINAAATVLFLVSGREKAAMLHRVIDGPREPEALPAQAIAPHHGRLMWLVDAAAATDLDGNRTLR